MKRYAPNAWLYRSLLAVFACFVMGTQLSSHEVRPGLLEIDEREPGWFDVTWKVPTRNQRALALTPRLPSSFTVVARSSVRLVPGARIERATYKSNGETLSGQTIEIDGLSALQIDVLIRISLTDGTVHTAILRPTSPSYKVPEQPGSLAIMKSYWLMGIEHIFGGFDHLLFVLALVLIIPSNWALIKAITAFTVAHSITLGLASLGYVHVPAAPTEAIIALSILFLAVEIVRSHEGHQSLTERAPWIVAFVFGLFHGLGFAGALTELGLPQHAIPLALLMFNVGVECGQLLFVLFVLAIIAFMRRLEINWPEGSWRTAPYVIGSLAAFWTFERVGSFLVQ